VRKLKQNRVDNLNLHEIDSHPYSMINKGRHRLLEKCWTSLLSSPDLPESVKIELSTERNKQNSDNSLPLDSLMASVQKGHYPSPEVLQWLLNCFEIYFDSGGELTLDQVFFGNSIQKKGSPSDIRMKYRKYQYFHWFVEERLEEAKKENQKAPGQPAMAEAFVNTPYWESILGEVNIDSFLRGWRRWKKQADN